MAFPFLSSKKTRISEVARKAERYEAEAEAALDSGDLDGAIECYRTALELCPFNNSLRAGLAEALMMKAEKRAAASDKNRNRESGPALPRTVNLAPQKRSAVFHEPRQVIRSSKTNAPIQRDSREAIDESDNTDARPGGMAQMDMQNAGRIEGELEKTRQARIRKNASAAARRRDAGPGVERPSGRSRGRYFLVAAMYSGLLLVLVGVAHGVISNAMESAPLPQAPKVEPVPDGVSLALEQATRELMRGAPSTSVEILERALEQNPRQQELLNAALARSLRAMGNKHLDGRDYAKAADVFERATRADPLNADNWIELGRSFREHGRSSQSGSSAEGRRLLERSRDAYNRALEVSPNDPAALVGLAQVYGFLGERQKAVENYQAVVAHSPESKEAGLARQHLAQLVGRS